MARCSACDKRLPFMNFTGDLCRDCDNLRLEREEEERALRGDQPDPDEVERQRMAAELSRILLTTESSPDVRIAQRLGIVAAECVFGMNLFKDIFTLGRDIFGGRSGAAQNTLRDARKVALDELRTEAHALGADAVIAVGLDYSEISGGGKSMLFLVATGTAVRLEKA